MVFNSQDINIIADMEGTTGVKLHNNKQKLRNRFDIMKKLGQGTYGKVQLAVNKDTGEEVAIKTIRKTKIESESDLVRIQREIQIMSSVQHPHIIHIYEVFENKEKIVLVMEYASGGELYDYLSYKKFLEEHEARRVFRQVVAAVYYCHKNMICHRDLKLENILLDEKGNAKIADFGLSNIFNEKNLLSTFCGSPLYASPEIVQGKPYFGPEVDCWSLGVLLYTLVYGAMPFDGSNFKKLVKQISEGDYYEPAELSDASGLIRKMLTVCPKKRATIDDICTDEWVDTGEETSLAVVSREFCNQMPVRLDYLLALTGNGEAALSELDDAGGDGIPLTSTEDLKTSPENELEKTADDEEDSKAEENTLKMEVDLKENEALLENDVAQILQENKECVTEEKEETTTKPMEPSLKRISSFGKKSASKTSLFKSKTSSETATNKATNGVAISKTDKLKKSGSVNEKADKAMTVERKPWVTPGARVSPIKNQTSIPPTSPINKNSSLSKFTKRGSVDKSDPNGSPELAKPPLRGSRVGSPTKQFQDSLVNKAAAPSEANKPAIEAKKSPPKTPVRQNSTREVSPKKFGPGARGNIQQEKDVPKKVAAAVPRPKSPIKTARSNSIKSNETVPNNEQLSVAVKTNLGEKRGSIEIAPLQVTRKYAEETTEEENVTPQPLVSFTPKNKGGFTLLGVKSEVSFGVDEAQQAPLPVSVVVDNEKQLKEEDKNDKIIKYVATIKKHGKENAKTDDSPERVTLLQLKCAPSVDNMSEYGAASSVTSENSTAEQRGYNVYRSKYRSIHKYRSVVEHQIGNNEIEEKEEKVRKEDKQKPTTEVEHSDSFSSAGSNDDLEDVFESLNSETMFTNLLSRTRNLIQRLSSGSIGINATSSGTSSFSFNSPGISLRLTTNKQSQKSSVASSNSSIASRRFGRSSSQSVQNHEQASSSSSSLNRKYLDDSSKWERRSRFDNFMASSRPPPPEEPQRELISSFLRNRNQSLDTRRPRSYYGSVTTGCLPGLRSSREDFTRSKDNESSDNYQYSKSYSRQVSEESVESSSARHTSTRLLNLRNPGMTTSSNSVPGSSVTRDYSRSASQTAGKSYEEEEEIKKEHRVTEDKDSRSVITKKECVRRSVSQSESKVSNNNNKAENLSHQDSGIESMFGAQSPTTTITGSVGKPSPVKMDNTEHPLLGKHYLKPDDNEESSIHVSDSNETSSIGSDSTTNDQWTHSTSPSHISPSRCEEESVADRIRRKSFYSRFNESRSPRNKTRKQNSCLSGPGIASNAHLRHLLETDPFLDSPRSNHFDIHQQSEFTPHHHRMMPSQRWSVHLHSPTNSAYSTEGMGDYFNPNSSFTSKSESNSTLPRRSSFTGANGNEDLNGSGPSMARTHSLPEENAPPENSNPTTSSPYSSTGSLRRPRRLDLYDRSMGSDDHFSRPNWRQYGSVNASGSSLRDTLDSWEMPSFCRSNGSGSTTLSSLMDSLDSPSEVLQKAMELCDSLRKSK